jgi:cytochrome c-type biogenesis protein CcmE
LEPCTSYPAGLPDQVREGTTLTIEGRRYLETSFKAEILDMRREERFNARNISP